MIERLVPDVARKLVENNKINKTWGVFTSIQIKYKCTNYIYIEASYFKTPPKYMWQHIIR